MNTSENKIICINYRDHGVCKSGSKCPNLHKHKFYQPGPSADVILSNQKDLKQLMVLNSSQLLELTSQVKKLSIMVQTLQGQQLIKKTRAHSAHRSPQVNGEIK